MFLSYAIRVDLEETTQGALVNMLNEATNKFILTHELATLTGKSHFHGHVETTWSMERMRAKLKKFGISGKQLSVYEVKDKTKHTNYILKDGKIIYNNLFDQEFINSAAAYNEEVKKEIAKRKTKQLTWTQEFLRGYKPVDIPEIATRETRLQSIEEYVDKSTKTWEKTYSEMKYLEYMYTLYNIHYAKYDPAFSARKRRSFSEKYFL